MYQCREKGNYLNLIPDCQKKSITVYEVVYTLSLPNEDFFQHQCFTRPPFSKYKDSPLLGINNSVVCNLKVFHICSGFSSTFLCTSFLKILDTINRFLKVIGIVANIEVEENPQPEYLQKAADLESSLTLSW